MNKCKRFFACFCKIFPAAILILSWVNFLLIVVQWVLYLIDYCDEAIDRSPSASLDNFKYRKSHIAVLIVDAAIWILLHCGGSILRQMTYIEPYMYDPATGNTGCFKDFLFKKFGP